MGVGSGERTDGNGEEIQLKLKSAREFRHLTWLKARKGAKLNLGSSSVLSLSLEQIGPLDPSQQVGDANPGGDPELVELISNIYKVDQDQVLITNGAGEANLHAAMTCVEKGCEVLAERPIYQSLTEVSRFLGARVLHFNRRMKNGFGVDLEEIKRKMTRKCRLVILSNLNNPTCAMLDRPTVEAIAEIAADRGAMVLSDEVYLDCAVDSGTPPLASLADNAFSTNSLSKAYGAGGFRMGWLLASTRAVRAVKSIRDHTTIAPNRIGEEVAKNILRQRQHFLDRTLGLTTRNSATMEAWVESRDDVEWFKPPFGTVCFPKMLKKTSTVEMGRRLFEEESTLVCPGEFFLMPGHFRMGLGGEPAKMLPGLEALGRVLDRVK
jgi:hypothetical protein